MSSLWPGQAALSAFPGMDRYEAKCAELCELQATFDDFQATSSQIEEELEKELKEVHLLLSCAL